MSNDSVQLAHQGDFSVCSSYEAIYVKHIDGRSWDVGEMYGDPRAAIFTWDEHYVVIIGCGILVYDLHRLGEKFTGGPTWKNSPVMHLMNDAADIWWFIAVQQVYQDEYVSEVRLATDLTDSHVGIYSLNVINLDFSPVARSEKLR
jgi:hypothetical protein